MGADTAAIMYVGGKEAGQVSPGYSACAEAAGAAGRPWMYETSWSKRGRRRHAARSKIEMGSKAEMRMVARAKRREVGLPILGG